MLLVLLGCDGTLSTLTTSCQLATVQHTRRMGHDMAACARKAASPADHNWARCCMDPCNAVDSKSCDVVWGPTGAKGMPVCGSITQALISSLLGSLKCCPLCRLLQYNAASSKTELGPGFGVVCRVHTPRGVRCEGLNMNRDGSRSVAVDQSQVDMQQNALLCAQPCAMPTLSCPSIEHVGHNYAIRQQAA